MLNTRTTFIAVLVLACAVVTAQAATWETSGNTGTAVRDIIHPLAPQQMSQSVDPNTIVTGTSVACGSAGIQTENGWWRLFDLDGDHGYEGDFCVEDVDYGIESSVGTQDTTVRVYCLDDGLPFLLQFLTQVGTNSQAQPDAAAEFFNITVGGCCDTTSQSMAVEMANDEDCSTTGNCITYFIGCNDLGQTGSTYLTSVSCGVNDPITTDAIGFPQAQMVMVVNGTDAGAGDDGGTDDGGAGDDGGGGVPATTGVGLVLLVLVLALGGGSAYFLRRK
jgi:hypothetical protein